MDPILKKVAGGMDPGPVVPDPRVLISTRGIADPGPDEPQPLAPPAADVAELFRARVVAHSIVRDGSSREERNPLLTFQVTAPRVILAEINTHRALSRSSESSRAIPAARTSRSTPRPWNTRRRRATRWSSKGSGGCGRT